MALSLLVRPATGAEPEPEPSAGPPAAACEAISRDLAEAERSARECEESRRTAAAACQASTEALASTTTKLSDAESREAACLAKKTALCADAARFAHAITEGRVTNVGECIASGDQEQLVGLLRGWDSASRALAQLGAFSAGETDVLPSVGTQSSPERLVARLLGARQKEPLLYRRLFIEALRFAVPDAWARIQRGGPRAVEAWFSSSVPLESDLVSEIRRKQGSSATPDAPPLTAALRLVTAYSLVARCSPDTPTHTCARARQLEQLIESTGPLLVRRRLEDVWSTDCSDIGPEVTLRWMEDFPADQSQSTDFMEVVGAVRTKLFTCFLGQAGNALGYGDWVERKLPGPTLLTPRKLSRIDELRPRSERDDIDACARAAQAIRSIPPSGTCTAPPVEILTAIESWGARPSAGASDVLPSRACERYVRALWEGQAAVIPPVFGHVPEVDGLVQVDAREPETSMSRLRRACAGRQGSAPSFVSAIQALSRVARHFGESPERDPWRIDPTTGTPIESARFARERGFGAFVRHEVSREPACAALGIPPERCRQCLTVPRGAFFDCDLARDLDDRWRGFRRATGGGIAGLFGAIALIVWALRMRRARGAFLGWAPDVKEQLAAIQLHAEPDPMRYVYPSRHDALCVTLPHEPAWERWGPRAAVVRVSDAQKMQEDDVHHAVASGRRLGARVIFLIHDENASLDFGAVRAVLDWAAKGGTRTMHVLPMPFSRLAWARTATDLLDLVEESSLRGNPFDVRGHITSSSQFWNREQLVSGILGEVRAGRWHVITGLRRFGKSSLALEVARRLPGPSAYVDLAGFHHEIAFLGDPSQAVDAILRSLCARLTDSARSLYPTAALPEPPSSAVDAAELTRWVRALSGACRPFHDGRSPPMLLVLDEIEQALALGPERLGRALDVLAILLGRLRNAVADVPQSSGSPKVGLLMCSALHPLLWAPLRTLGDQSIVGTFPYLCVPRLGAEAAFAMMRGLGARQGIRFADPALELVVSQAQGVPLLLRRLGTSILELYDADHARQGSLGAVNIGIEGAREALEREEREGSPLRVWIESEIASPVSAAGALLRKLACEETVPSPALYALAEEHVMAEFVSSGVAARLPADEQRRRTQEAARVLVRLLGDTKLLEPRGDLTAPEAYALPDGVIRRVLRLAISASPSPPRVR